jgi:hypothetical protein
MMDELGRKMMVLSARDQRLTRVAATGSNRRPSQEEWRAQP